MESKLGQWATSLGIAADTTDQEGFQEGSQEEAISIDGKTLRGSLKQRSSTTHLLSAVSHKLGLTLAQCSVDKETNEIGKIDEILNNIVLEGRIISVDAMHTQRKTSQTIVDSGGDYVMPVKDNQQYEFFTYRNKKEVKHGDTEARRGKVRSNDSTGQPNQLF